MDLAEEQHGAVATRQLSTLGVDRWRFDGLVRRGVTVLVTTHFMDEAEYCDQVTLIYRSKQIASGPPDALKAQAAGLTGAAEPTMEDAFIALIEASDAQREEAEAA